MLVSHFSPGIFHVQMDLRVSLPAFIELIYLLLYRDTKKYLNKKVSKPSVCVCVHVPSK